MREEPYGRSGHYNIIRCARPGYGFGYCALLFLDLDDFKKVNDVLGHQEGDRLLWKVAQILMLQTEDTDLCGRIGGDEFLVFMRHIRDREQAETCARHICEAIGCAFPCREMWPRPSPAASAAP